MQQAKVIAGPHVLYTGANVSKTAGVTVESVAMDAAACAAQGRKFRWDVNATVLQKDAAREALGLEADEQFALVDACRALETV